MFFYVISLFYELCSIEPSISLADNMQQNIYLLWQPTGGWAASN